MTAQAQEIVRAHLAGANEQTELTDDQRSLYRQRIKERLQARDAVMVAHYYTDPEIQSLAEETGGCVADSLEMARFGRDHPASTLIVAGVRFMGETAKILSPEKRVFMPTLEATCSLDIGCPEDEFAAFCDQHPDRTVVVYANTSAAVKPSAGPQHVEAHTRQAEERAALLGLRIQQLALEKEQARTLFQRTKLLLLLLQMI